MKNINLYIPTILKEAGDLAINSLFNSSVSSTFKKDGTIVTQVDNQIQDIFTLKLSSAYKDIPIIAEEKDYDKVLLSDAEYTWIIDPIDGTFSYANNTANWVIAIGLLNYGTPCAGWIYSPMTKTLYSAPYGDPFSYVNNTIITPSNKVSLTSKDAISVNTRALLYYDISHTGRVLSHGSNLLHMMLTATGSYASCLSVNNKAWDIFPGYEIVKRSGCSVLYMDGTIIDCRKVLSQKDKTMPKDVLITPTAIWKKVNPLFKRRKKPHVRN